MHRVRHVARSFASSARSRPFAAPHYIDVFYRDSKLPVWRLLDALKSPAGRLHLNAALAESGVGLDEYARWRPTIAQYDIQQALMQRGTCMPPWVVLFLLLYKVRTAEHASTALLALLHAHLPTAPEALHGPLLVLSAYQLARHNLVVPLQSLTDTFLTSPIPTEAQETAFNLFLDALSHAPLRSAALAALSVRVLAAMDARQLPLHPSTYRSLLADRFVTLQLTKHLLTRMAREPYPPTADHLEGFLRVFARDGAIHEARKYFAAIHAITTTLPPKDDAHDPRYAANTIMLSAHDNKASAFAFLRRLAQLSSEQAAPTTSQPASKPFKPPSIRFIARSSDNIYDQTAALHVSARDPRTPVHKLIRAFLRLPARPTVATHTVLVRGLLFRKAWARAALFWGKLERECLDATGVAVPVRPGAGESSSISNPPSIPRRKRERPQPSVSSSPDLLSTPPAWARAPNRRMVMDNAALTAGLQALVRAGRPLDALATLDRWAWRADMAPDALVGFLPTKSASPPSRAPLRIHLTTISYNELLVSFKRSSRPDAVFLLWDLMPFYGVSPDANTLGILLQAARMGVTMDDNLRGAMGGAVDRVRKAWKKLRRARALRGASSADATGVPGGSTGDAEGITHTHPGAGFDGLLVSNLPLLLHAHAQLRARLANPYVPGTQWRNRAPADTARAVFLQALFGMCEGLGAGHGVEPKEGRGAEAGGSDGGIGDKEGRIVAPAAAVRDAWDADARSVFRSPRPYVFTPPEGVLMRPPLSLAHTPTRLSSPEAPSPPLRTFHPSLAPTARTCLSYLALLSAVARAPEIPLLLAWMRRAGVQPSSSVLGMALVLWAEVGVQAPLVEMFMERAKQAEAGRNGEGAGAADRAVRGEDAGNERVGRCNDPGENGKGDQTTSPITAYSYDTDTSEYGRLVRFVCDWVGPRRVPGPRTLAKWRGVVLAMRRAGRGGEGV